MTDSSKLSRLGMWQTYTVIKYHGVTAGRYGSYGIDDFYYGYTSKSGTPIVNACYKTSPHKYSEPWSGHK